ncbi:EGF-like calcium-binding domain [Trinorchestia longiramus]|nr:EGF-like calcium-binding domain [Trinorchestia longiramus]
MCLFSKNPSICNGGKCQNVPGSFACQCEGGLLPDPATTGCVDVNECDMNSNLCQNGRCDNTVGSFTCRCEPGYSVKEN